MFPWSPDFPLSHATAAVRPTGRSDVSRLRRAVKSQWPPTVQWDAIIVRTRAQYWAAARVMLIARWPA
ncbi:hypothetical protein GCM10010994_27140 [Chelatococcus reniformis]|uniref:Uncharacterized protein n=1 Tax=Chelatococcus reniformis TaxID=1494448 RepID=A0A916UBP5_9HYPH|nr:hypothetical protein GCM10010994_27140 [Chelatococcus reniformis]